MGGERQMKLIALHTFLLRPGRRTLVRTGTKFTPFTDEYGKELIRNGLAELDPSDADNAAVAALEPEKGNAEGASLETTASGNAPENNGNESATVTRPRKATRGRAAKSGAAKPWSSSAEAQASAKKTSRSSGAGKKKAPTKG